MILESQGTPDILKEILLENFNIIQRIINNKENILHLDINKQIYINGKIVYFNSNLNIQFHYGNFNYTGDLNYLTCIENNFENCLINLYLPIIGDINSTYKVLSHELTHLYELYQIKNVFNKTKWNYTKGLIDFEKLSVYKEENVIQYFKNIFYLSLPHEIRARISSLEFYLFYPEIKDRNVLEEKLKNTNEWRFYLALANFNPVGYLNKLYKILKDENFIFEIFNIFNTLLKINITIKNKEDLLNYFDKCQKYFDKAALSYKKKMFKIVNKAINHNENYILRDPEIDILTFNDFKKSNRYNEIKYHKFF